MNRMHTHATELVSSLPKFSPTVVPLFTPYHDLQEPSHPGDLLTRGVRAVSSNLRTTYIYVTSSTINVVIRYLNFAEV